MKFSCEKFELQNLVMTASRAAASKSPIVALEGLLISAANSYVSVTGYDMKKGIYTKTAAEVKESGAVVISAKLLTEMMRKMPDGIISFETDERSNVKIKCGSSNFSIVYTPSEDYPELPSVRGTESIEIKRKLLKTMIDETSFAQAQNESRPVYTGSLFEFENGELTLVAVDGYRLALRREMVPDCGVTDQFIVPGSALSDVSRFCAEDEDKIVYIEKGDKHVSFIIDEVQVITRRLEGEFLNYKKALPQTFRYTVEAERAEMLKVVDRVSIMVDERIKSPLRLTFSDGSIGFLCVTPAGRAEDTCMCEGTAEEIEIGFNDRYLRDALRVVPAEKIKIGINTGSSPCLLMPTDGNNNFAYMILPVRLRAGE